MAGQPDSTTCAICLEDLATVAEVARPNTCKHLFCRGCLESLCRLDSSSRRCPLDRKTFSRIHVRQRGDASSNSETILTAETLAPIQRMSQSPALPISLGVILLAVLWASPSWLLAVHAASVSGIYWYTDSTADWTPYGYYSVVFYCCLVPVSFFGFWATASAWGCGALIAYGIKQISIITRASQNAGPEKILLGVTCALAAVIIPALSFSLYTVAQTYCYTLCLFLTVGAHGTLHQSHGEVIVRYSLLFSCMLMAPFICLLSEMTMSHLVYMTLLAVCFACGIDHGNRQQQMFVSITTALSKLTCYLAPSMMLGFALWTALYVVAVLAYGIAIFKPIAARLRQRVPLLLAINAVLVGFLLPWKLFGLFSYLGCSTVILVSGFLTEMFLNRVYSMLPSPQFGSILVQYAVLGILLPAVVFL